MRCVLTQRWVENINNLCLQKQTLKASLTIWGVGLGAVFAIRYWYSCLLKAFYLALQSFSYFFCGFLKKQKQTKIPFRKD